MEILKAIKNEIKENWGYAVGAVIGGIIVQYRTEKQTRECVERTLSMGYLHDYVYSEVEGIELDHNMTYSALMDYLEFKCCNKPNKKKKIQYLKEKGFID